MGTTVTTNLGLIKPDDDESIKEALPTFAGWATQNGVNCDKVDALFKDDNSSYTPTFQAGGVAVTLGASGFVTGKAIRVFPRIVVGYVRIFMGGAGFTPGAGTYRITFPAGSTHVAPEITTLFESAPIGKAFLFDADNIATSSTMTVHYDLSTGSMHFRSSAGNLWNPTVPITLAQNDRVSCYFIYPTTDA